MMFDQPILFAATSNPDAAQRFYEETLGLDLVADEMFALVFDVAGTPLRIQKLPTYDPPQHTVLGWQVDDIRSAIAELKARGVEFVNYPELPQDADGVWEIAGVASIAWFRDPDGNTLSLTEHCEPN